MEGPYHALEVSRVIDETHDTRSLVLAIPEPLREAFRYRAGQFLTFRFEVAERRLVRCYSLASSPDTDAEHKVTVKRVSEGRVSNFVNDQVLAGTTLEVMRPAGRFCLGEHVGPLVAFAGGSGITPVISILKTALETSERELQLFYANRDRPSIIFADELAALERSSNGRLRVHHHLDEEAGFANASRIAEFATLDDASVYVCGPGPFMDVVEGTVKTLGVPDERFFIERFEYASEGVPSQAPATAATAGDGLVAQISLDGETRQVPVAAGETIVEAARRAGMDPPTACEEGYCACCMARLKAGAGEMKANDVLDKRQLAEGWVLTCQFVPSEPPEIEYPD